MYLGRREVLGVGSWAMGTWQGSNEINGDEACIHCVRIRTHAVWGPWLGVLPDIGAEEMRRYMCEGDPAPLDISCIYMHIHPALYVAGTCRHGRSSHVCAGRLSYVCFCSGSGVTEL